MNRPWEVAQTRHISEQEAELLRRVEHMIIPGPCCDLHNQHCEPPADLCCFRCTERAHPEHPRGVRCVLGGDA